MLTFVLDVLFTAIIFSAVVPKVRGAYFRGSFFTALLQALIFQVVVYALVLLGAWLAVLFTVATLGLGVFLVILGAMVSFWLVPAVALRVQAGFFPDVIGFDSWKPILIVSLLIFVTSLFTSSLELDPTVVVTITQ